MLLIKFATRGRFSWFKRTFDNIFDTIEGTDFLLAITADEDDAQMNNDVVKSIVDKQPNAVITYGKSESKIHAINRDMELFQNWTWLVNMSDDMFFIKKGWNKIIEKRVKEHWGGKLDWFAHFSDGYVHDSLPTMSIMDRAYYERDEYIYYGLPKFPQGYKSFSCDAEAMYVAMMRQRYHYFPNDFLFKHLHASHLEIPNDKTYDVNSKATDHDTKLYWRRLNNYFDVKPADRKVVPFAQYIGRHA